MRKILFFCVVFAAMAVLLFAPVVADSAGRRDRNRDIRGYNVLAERMFEGSVAGKPYMVEDTVYFPLRTAYSVVQIQIGPKEFVERSNFKIKSGDMLTVTGMPIMMNGREVVLAREVRSMDGVLIVRDPMGRPLWESDGPIQMDPEHQMRFLVVT